MLIDAVAMEDSTHSVYFCMKNLGDSIGQDGTGLSLDSVVAGIVVLVLVCCIFLCN